MRTKRQQIGDRAEEAAAEFLLERGCTPVARNFRCKLGELDLIAIDGDVLTVIEVRTRGTEIHGGAAASVDGSKRHRLVRAAQSFLLRHSQFARLKMRFDVIVVTELDSGRPRIEWLKHAFEARLT
jgi:putative endonuclease